MGNDQTRPRTDSGASNIRSNENQISDPLNQDDIVQVTTFEQMGDASSTPINDDILKKLEILPHVVPFVKNSTDSSFSWSGYNVRSSSLPTLDGRPLVDLCAEIQTFSLHKTTSIKKTNERIQEDINATLSSSRHVAQVLEKKSDNLKKLASALRDVERINRNVDASKQSVITIMKQLKDLEEILPHNGTDCFSPLCKINTFFVVLYHCIVAMSLLSSEHWKNKKLYNNRSMISNRDALPITTTAPTPPTPSKNNVSNKPNIPGLEFDKLSAPSMHLINDPEGSPPVTPTLTSWAYNAHATDDELYMVEDSKKVSEWADDEKAVDEAILLFRLTRNLLYILGFALGWVFALSRMLIFILLLFPAFFRLMIYLLTDKNIIHSVRYGLKPRNFLNIFVVPEEKKKNGTTKAPVVVFVTGGAWIIGYRAWGSLIGKTLAERGIMCVCPDYRNFPQGTVTDMVQDVDCAMKWTFQNIELYGGDVNNVFLIGQSAGAHLSLLSFLFNGKMNNSRDRTWNPDQLKGLVGVSGQYNLPGAARAMVKKGMRMDILELIFEKKMDFFSPLTQVKMLKQIKDKPSMHKVPIVLLHGTIDMTCSCKESVALADHLRDSGFDDVTVKLYDGKSHTDTIIEDPIGGSDPLITDVVNLVRGKRIDPYGKVEIIKGTRLMPEFIIDVARKLNPF
ncbi:prenylcysteine alpha-carboxyl methylesterase [Acrasis kona]|uniref:Prenylcysteine alpha-carboxyl methylesterase n=1 Tax=Acrasis kona TaxID=1008807 RepID=A0AAW2ZIX4_9EUKA